MHIYIINIFIITIIITTTPTIVTTTTAIKIYLFIQEME